MSAEFLRGSATAVRTTYRMQGFVLKKDVQVFEVLLLDLSRRL